jgi:hypothetical protein
VESIAVERRGRGPLAWLIVSQALALLTLLPWLILFALSRSGSGAPSGPLAWLVLALVWIYPVVLLACMVMSWRAYRRGETRRAAVRTTIPLLWAVPLLVWVGWLLTLPG